MLFGIIYPWDWLILDIDQIAHNNDNRVKLQLYLSTLSSKIELVNLICKIDRPQY